MENKAFNKQAGGRAGRHLMGEEIQIHNQSVFSKGKVLSSSTMAKVQWSHSAIEQCTALIGKLCCMEAPIWSLLSVDQPVSCSGCHTSW